MIINTAIPDVVKNHQCAGCLRDASEGCYVKKDDSNILCRLYYPTTTFATKNVIEKMKCLGNEQVDRMRIISKAKNDASLTRIIGVSRGVVHQWRFRKSGMTEKMLGNAAEKLNIDIEWIRSGNKTNINLEEYP